MTPATEVPFEPAGLSSEEVERRRAAWGANRLPELRGRTWGSIYRETLRDRTLRVLLAAAAVVLVVDLAGGSRPIEAIAILAAVGVASLFTTHNDWRAQAHFRSLQQEKEAFDVRAARDGAVRRVDARELVVGDVVLIETGDKVPADGRLARGTDVEVDESLLTGESTPCTKNPDGDADLRAGTLIAEGRGTMVVTAVGERTEYGRLRSDLFVEQEATPLQVRLGRLADRLSLFAAGAAVLVTFALMGAGLVRGLSGGPFPAVREMLDTLLLGITIVVVAVPEGLPVAVTLSLAYSVLRMARENCLVRRLLACETMGAAEVVCVDKTGTLTLNRMRVERLAFAGGETRDPARREEVSIWTRERFVEIAAANSSAHYEEGSAGRRLLGSPTEGALLDLVGAWGEDYRAIRRRLEATQTFGFTSDRKRMSTVVRAGNDLRLLVKGAPEIVLARCTRVLSAEGVRGMTAADGREFQRLLDAWGNQALRPLALAYRDLAHEAGPRSADLEGDLVLVCLVGIGDPLRESAREAVRACREAGVEVKMVTGDARLTAEAVARSLDLLREGDLHLEGSELRAASDEEIRERLPRVRVVSRAVPADKLRIVQLLQAEGLVVAATGDGTNDAPALRHADVGLSLGLSGTDVAREASDIVLRDDDFATAVRAIRWGRGIFANVRKFLQFQLTVSGVAFAIAFVAAATGQGTPLSVVQLLWVNLILDAIAAVALSLEQPGADLLADPPHGKRVPLFSPAMVFQMAAVGSVMLAILVAILYGGLFVPRDDPAHFTFLFNVFVLLQLGNLVNCRTTRFDRSPLRGLLAARAFLALLGGIAVLQFLAVQFGGEILRTVPLDGRAWATSLLLGGGMVGVGALLRLAGRSLPEEWPARLRERARALPLELERARLRARGAILSGLPAPVGAAGAVLAAAGLGLGALGGGLAAPGYLLFALGIAAAGLWAWGQRGLFARRGPRTVRLHAGASSVLLLVLAVYTNHVASRHYRRLDLTQAQRFTLSPESLAALDRLRAPLRITSVFREGQLAAEVRDLLAEYTARGRLVQVHHIDPDRDPGEVERLVDRTGLAAARLSSIVLEHRERVRLLPAEELLLFEYVRIQHRRVRVANIEPTFKGEEALTSAIAALESDAPVRVGFVTGHGERSPDDFGPEGLALARDRLRRQGFETETFLLVGGAPVPPGVQVLVQAGPQRRLEDEDLASIDAFLQKGGKWLLLVEPRQAGGLEPLLSEWGIGVRPVHLVDPTGQIAGLGPTTLVASRFQRHSVTSALAGASLVFPFATSVHFRGEGERPLDGVNLVLTSEDGLGLRDGAEAAGGPSAALDYRPPLSVATAVEEPVDHYAADGRREPARIVIVGDADFATNSHFHRLGNADFFLNGVDWLARREALIALRARPAEVRNITLTANARRAAFWTVLGVLPGCVAILGLTVAWRRRK